MAIAGDKVKLGRQIWVWPSPDVSKSPTGAFQPGTTLTVVSVSGAVALVVADKPPRRGS